MRTLLRPEEAALFVAAPFPFATLDYLWRWFPALLLAPNLSVLGYAAGPRAGSYVYNLVHHRGAAIDCCYENNYAAGWASLTSKWYPSDLRRLT